MNEEIRTRIEAAGIDINKVMWTPDGTYRIRIGDGSDPADFAEFDEYRHPALADLSNDLHTWRVIKYWMYRPECELHGTLTEVLAQIRRWVR